MVHCGGCASAAERCGNGLEKIYPTTAVRFGRMRHIGEFSHPPDLKFTCGAKVVIATDRGIEIGQQVSLTCFGCEKSVPRDQMRAYAETCGGDAYQLKKGRILREATPADLAEWKHIEDSNFEKIQTARRIVARLGLPMKVVDCEHLFGGERIVFYFLAEERVDFRELVRQLAGEYQTRIEMRQIGARDEARLVADYETCGRECCCKNFLKTLKPISMQMAKLQKATLDPSKVSGRCGRLKCCLRYEHESYEELDRKLPRLGVRVRTTHGTGQVIDRQILTQLVKIRCDDDRLMTVVMEDVLEVGVPPPVGPGPQAADDRRRGTGRPRTDQTSPGPRSENRPGPRRDSRSGPWPPAPHDPPETADGSGVAEGAQMPTPRDPPPSTEADPPEGGAPPDHSERKDSGRSETGRPRGRSWRRRRRGGGGEGGSGRQNPGPTPGP
ncbi:MAG: hypothetical protein HRF43_17050 [Phycisphaerae bacterium]